MIFSMLKSKKFNFMFSLKRTPLVSILNAHMGPHRILMSSCIAFQPTCLWLLLRLPDVSDMRHACHVLSCPVQL